MNKGIKWLLIGTIIFDLWYAFGRDWYRFWFRKPGTERWKWFGRTRNEWSGKSGNEEDQ